jgi:6-phosphogluconolactonase
MAAAHGHLLLASGYAPAEQPGIHAFLLDARSGALTRLGSAAVVPNPSYLLAHPNGQTLYAVGEMAQADGEPGSVWALRFQTDPFEVELLGKQPSGGDHPCHLALDLSGRWLIVSNYSSGTVGVLALGEDGALGPLSDLIQHHGRGPHDERQAGPHAHSATFVPDGRHVIVADLGIDQLIVYSFDARSGRLGAHSHAQTRPGAGPRHVAFHPDGEHLYVANELNSTVDVYDYEASSGGLYELHTYATLPPEAPHNQVADIHVDASGRWLYVSNRGHDSIAVFRIDGDGMLTRAGIWPCGGRWPRNFALAPGGNFMVVANQHSDEIAVLPIREDADRLGEPVARAAVSGASCVRFV